MWRKPNLPGRLLLAGWALYITVVTASNLTELFWSFGWENWAFRSGNLAYITAATRLYFRNEQANQALLALVIGWGAAAAALLWLAALRWARSGEAAPGGEAALACARRGLVLLGLLWFGFAISTELFVAYDRGVDESAYWTLATAVLVTVAVLEIWAPLRQVGGRGSADPGIAECRPGHRLRSRRLADPDPTAAPDGPAARSCRLPRLPVILVSAGPGVQVDPVAAGVVGLVHRSRRVIAPGTVTRIRTDAGWCAGWPRSCVRRHHGEYGEPGRHPHISPVGLAAPRAPGRPE